MSDKTTIHYKWRTLDALATVQWTAVGNQKKPACTVFLMCGKRADVMFINCFNIID